MAARTLLAGEYAVLGLLSLRPMHGYEMAFLLAEEGLSEVFPVEQSTLYTYLHNLERRGFVAWSEARAGNRPPRKTYALTPEGARLTGTWLREPVHRMREVRLEFLLKIYFLEQLDPPAAQTLLHRQVDACGEYIERLRGHATDTSFARLVMGSKRSAAEGTLRWLQSYATELEVVIS